MITPYQQTQTRIESEPKQTTPEPKTRLPQKTKAATGKRYEKTQAKNMEQTQNRNIPPQDKQRPRKY